MVDYTRPTGASGTMLIRHLPESQKLEFWLHAANPDTFNLQLPWDYIVNGVHSPTLYFRFVSGAVWQKLGEFTVTYNQTVFFTIGDTETVGLGGPSSLRADITAVTVPGAPSAFQIYEVTETTIKGQFFATTDGNSPVLEWQLAYGTNPNEGQIYVASTGPHTVTGLIKGTTYYFWSRGRNAVGWGAWSARAQATTTREPDAPKPVIFANITQTSVGATFANNGNGGSAVLEWEFGYGLDPNSPQFFRSGFNDTFANLSSGETYYFWARGRNVVGWGPWSAVRSVVLIAGAYVKVGPVHKRAVPYLNVNGVWKLARPWAKAVGVWKEISS